METTKLNDGSASMAAAYTAPPDFEFLAFGLYWKFKGERCFRWTGEAWVRSLMCSSDFKKSNCIYPPVAEERKG